MAKKAKGIRVQVILECTELKESGMHRSQRQWYAGYISLYYNKEQKEYNSEIGADEV